LLGLIDFRYEAVTDGAVAFERVLQLRPKLVLLDLQLPNVSGFDILTSIRKDARLYNTKVIVITSEKFIELAKVRQADGVLVKLFTLSALRIAIEKVLCGDMGTPPDQPFSSGFGIKD
jgi:DNA-binding response OmpR family regulator